MGSMAGLLSYALIFTGYQLTYSPVPNFPGYPAWCLLHPHELENATKAYSQAIYVIYDSAYIAFIMTFLAVTYFTRTIRLFPLASDKIRAAFHTKPSLAFKNKLARLKHRVSRAKTTSGRRFRRLSYTSLLSVYCLLESTYELYMSLSWEVRGEPSPNELPHSAEGLLDHMVSFGPRMGN